MDLFINDLSLHGQFSDHHAFRQSLEEIMRCHTCVADYGRSLRVSRSVINRPVVDQTEFRQAVQAAGDKTFIRLVMNWIAKNGPFIEDDLSRDPDEYLTIENEMVVTEEAIGEAATRYFNELPVGLVSFAPSRHEYTPIEVFWHRSDTITKTCELHNVWQEQELRRYLDDYRAAPKTWEDLILQLPARFPHLTFLPNLKEHLTGEPFIPHAVERIFVLLDVLNQLKTGFDANGRRTPESETLVDNYFRREKARFSDSSDQEKNDSRHRAAMTFRDLEGRELICFWHGKIKTPQYRIHFSYPIKQEEPLYIAYIGPKLTKK